MTKNLIYLLIFVMIIFLFSVVDTKDFFSVKKNIYGKPLKTCELRGSPNEGSQQNDYTCSEIGGGFHQICVENIGQGKSFSKNTGQSNWSDSKDDRNHCVCLGAWANFAAQPGNDKKLVCTAIPETSLYPEYVKNWEELNDVTINNQAQSGVNELYRQCINPEDPAEKKYFQQLYCNLVKHPEINLKDITKSC